MRKLIKVVVVLMMITLVQSCYPNEVRKEYSYKQC
jgi:hypothetical protein